MNTFKSYLFKNNKLKWPNENFETLPRIITINPHKSKKIGSLENIYILRQIKGTKTLNILGSKDFCQKQT